MVKIKELGMLYPTPKSKSKKRYALYECPKCFSLFKTQIQMVKQGRSTQCFSCANKKHGCCHHKLYATWNNQWQRCNNPKNPHYNYYGDRGIKFSLEFEDITVWLNYVENLPNVYKKGYSLDRIDNEKGYEEGNLRWVNKSIQTQNTRLLYKSNSSGYRGVTKNGKRWKSMVGVKVKIYI